MAQEATTKVVKFKDVEYTIPTLVLEDLDALEAFEDSKYATFVKAVLGRKQYAEFRKTSSTTEDLGEMVALLLDAGETDEE